MKNNYLFQSIRKTGILCLVLSLMISPVALAHKDKNKAEKPKEISGSKAKSWLKNQPVEFLENKGQVKDAEGKPVPFVLFKAEAPGVDMYITEKGLSYVFTEVKKEEEHENEYKGNRHEPGKREEKFRIKYERLDMELVGAQIKKENIVKEDASEAEFNFLIGPASQAVYHAKKFRKVTIKNIYPGIDWVLYNSTHRGFKYDFIVHPGADQKQIELVYRSKKELNLDKQGNILIKTNKGLLEEKAPYSYISENGQKIESRFRLISKTKKNKIHESHIGFDLPLNPGLNNSQTLVIDPQLVWSTFYGANDYEGTMAIEADKNGNIIMTGYTGGTTFPLLNAGTFFQAAPSYAFIIKFNNTGTLLWATFYGGTAGNTICYAITSDNSNNIFLCGSTNSTDFPLVNANTYYQGPGSGADQDAFIAKFDNLGNCTWATLYGGTDPDEATDVTTDASGNVFLTGTTTSTNFPVQNAGTYFEASQSALNQSSGSGFIVKFNNGGTRLWATYIKGIDFPLITNDPAGNIYLTGGTSAVIPLTNPGGTTYYQGAQNQGDLFILKFDNNGNQLWGTYYGGSSSENAQSVTADKFGNLFVAGETNSQDFPLQNAGTYFQAIQINTLTLAPDLFILKFNNSGTRMWGTSFGGNNYDMLATYDNLEVDTCGNLYFAFNAESSNIVTQIACDGGFFDGTLDSNFNSQNDIFLTRFSNNGTLLWGTYFGGDGYDFRSAIDVDQSGSLFVTGEWTSVLLASSYPTVNPGGTSYNATFSGGYDDIYIAKFVKLNPAPQNFSYTGGYCVTDTNQVPIKAPGFISGGTFSAAPGLSVNPQTGQVIPGASTPGNYTVTYSSVSCDCQGSSNTMTSSATVSILTTPVLSITGNGTICIGQKATYTASGASSYTWNPGTLTNTMTVTPTTTATLIYTVTGKNTNGCADTKTLSVKVNKCTGIEDLVLNSAQLEIYPNPNNGEFTISSDKDVSFRLISETGQLIRQIELSEKNHRKVEIRGLANGIYFISDDAGSAHSKYKIIVSN